VTRFDHAITQARAFPSNSSTWSPWRSMRITSGVHMSVSMDNLSPSSVSSDRSCAKKPRAFDVHEDAYAIIVST